MNDSAERPGIQFRQELFFWCCAAVSLLSLLGSHSLFWLEPNVAEAAREIAVTGRWYPFTVNFEPYSGLPPLEVWSIALVFKLGISEFAARLPSALAAFALLIGVFELAKRLFDRRTALLTTWLTLGSFGLLYMGRCCAPGVLSAAIAVWASVLYLRGAGKRNFWNALAVSLLLAVGVLNYGVKFFFVAGALLAPWMYANRRSFHWKIFPAVLIAAALAVLAWVFLFGDPWRSICSFFARFASVEGACAMLKHWLDRWCHVSGNPAGGICDLTLVMLPWVLITLASLGGALCKLRRLSREERGLLTGLIIGFLVLVIRGTARRTDFLPLMPFLAIETGVCVLRGDGGRLTRWAVVATRSVVMVLASFVAVSPVTIPLWRRVMNLELPMLFWAVCILFGVAVLLIMMLDSHPSRPLPRLTGLPDPLGSTILGGTLMSICLLSFLMPFLLPSMRELRVEKPFMEDVGSDVAKLKPAAVVNIGGRDFAVMLLFYARIDGKVTTIPERDGKLAAEELVRELSRHPGKRVAVIAGYRRKELDILHRISAAAKLDIKVKSPYRKELLPYIYSRPHEELKDEPLEDNAPFLQHACWLVTVPEWTAMEKNDDPNNVRNKGM